MFESILTISVTGFIAGFIFAMPIAGPVSILIVSNALRGRLSYSRNISAGAAVSDFIYIFLAVYGLTSLYSFYLPAIPYLFIAGALFFCILALRIYRSPVDLGNLEGQMNITPKIPKSDLTGYYTGFMVNMLNPTLFLSGLISSFFVISFIASLGLNTGGFENGLNNTMNEIGSIDGSDISNNTGSAGMPAGKWHHFTLSLSYAFFLSLGGLLWFYLLAWVLVRYRHAVSVRILNILIKLFAVSLALLGIYFGWQGILRL